MYATANSACPATFRRTSTDMHRNTPRPPCAANKNHDGRSFSAFGLQGPSPGLVTVKQRLG
eukprot:9059380-Pyramimonas_sp.AAC.1